MSYFDLDPVGAESARQNARLNPITPGDMGPGFWGKGVLSPAKGLGLGVLQSGAQGALALGDAGTAALMPGAKKIDDLFGGSNAQDYLRQEQLKNHDAVKWLMPGPDIGSLGQFLYGAGTIVPQAVAGTVAAGGNPLGGAATVASLHGYAAKLEAQDKGVDPATATTQGIIEGVTAGVGVIMPAAFGETLLARFGTAAAANVTMGAAQRGATSALLEARGYGELAEQYKVFDKNAILTDAILGLAFGGVHHYFAQRGAAGEAPPVIPPSVADEALAANKQQHLEISTAPGIPADPQSRGLHSRAIDQAMRDIMADEPVDVSRTGIENAAFVENRHVQEAQVKAALAEQGPLRSALDAIDELRQRAQELGITPDDEVLFEGKKLVGDAPADTAPNQIYAVLGTPGEVGVQRILPDGTKQVLLRRSDGSVFWGDRKTGFNAKGEKAVEGADAASDPVVYKTAKEAKEAGRVADAGHDAPSKPLSKLEAGRQRIAKQEAAVRAAEESIARRKLAAEAHGPRDLPGAVHGRDGEVFVGDRREPVRFVLVEADALAATIGKADNQFRDRTRVASQVQIARISNDLQFGRLGEAPTMVEGAPTVAQTGEIVGGNGRVAAIQQAYANGRGEGYRVALEQRAAEFGLTAGQVTGMTRPMLVRQFTNHVDIRTAAILSNEGGGLKMSALEHAKVDAERMPSMPEIPESGDLTAASLREFVSKWLSRYPQDELGDFVDNAGKLSPDGEKRLSNAIVFKAYGDSPTLARLIESTDDLSKNLTGALVRSAGNVAEAREMIAAGELHDLDIQPQLLQAVDITRQLRADGVKLDAWIDQHDMYGTGVGPESILLMEHFQKSARSQKAMMAALTGYYDAVRSLGDPRQANMFDAPPPSRGEILRAVLEGREVVREVAIAEADAQASDSVKNVLTIDPREKSFSYIIKDAASDTSGIKSAEPNEIGRIVGNIRGDALRVTTSGIVDEYKGLGRGTKAYADLVDQAAAAGKHVESDIELTPAAASVYEKLAALGYDVERNPRARIESDGKLVSPSGPVFKVKPKVDADGAAKAGQSYGGKIPLGEKLSASDRAVEQRFAAWVLEDVDRAVAEYAKLPDSNGGKVLNTDVARDLSRDYAASKDSKSALSAAVHEPASWLVKEIYRRKLAEKAGEGERNKVTFTAGGTGAGKSSGIRNVPEAQAIVDTSQIVYDTNMNTMSSAVSRVEQALAAGKDVSLIYVARDPVAALTQGALPRAMRMGRTVPLGEHAKTHIGAAEVVQKLATKYKDNPRVDVQIVDNTGPNGSQRLADIATVKNIDYTDLEARLRTALDAEHNNGRISDAVYQGTLGRDDGKGQPGGARSAAKTAEGGPPKAPDGGEPQDTFASDGRGDGAKPAQPAAEGLSATTVDQVLHDAPNAQTLDADGEIRNAQMALADADQTITRAEKDAPGYDAAAACALR